MPTDIESPVTEQKPSTENGKAPQTEQKPAQGSRFPKITPLSKIVTGAAPKKPEPEKPAAEAKPSTEKAPEAPPKAEKPAQESAKPSGDTETTPKEESGSVRARLSQGEAAEEPVKETKPAVEEEELADDDPTVTDKFRRKVKRLRGETAKEREARESAEKKAKELEGRLAELEAKPKITEAQQKEWQAKDEELLRLRRRFSLESDPEVKKFDTRIEAAKKTVESTVARSVGIPSWVKEHIKTSGGLEAFLRSPNLYDVTLTNPDGTKETKKFTGSQIYRHITPEIDPIDIGTIQTSIGEQNRLQAEKSAFIEQETGKAKEWFDQQAKQSDEARQQAENTTKQTVAMFGKIGDTINHEKWMQDEEVPATGDEDEIKTIKSRNTLRKALRSLVAETINFKPTSSDPAKAQKEVEEFYTGVVRDSAKLYYAEHELKQAKARIKKLEADLDAIKGASRTTPRGSNGAAAPAASGGGKRLPAQNTGEGPLAYWTRLLNAGWTEEEIREARSRGK